MEEVTREIVVERTGSLPGEGGLSTHCALSRERTPSVGDKGFDTVLLEAAGRVG